LKTKMLEDEPDRPITGRKIVQRGMTEEEKFDQSEAFDRDFLTKKYPGLALANVRNKEEIDIFGDLEDDAGLKREDRKLDIGKQEPKKTKKSRSCSRSKSPLDRRKRRHSSSSSRDRRHHRRDDYRTREDEKSQKQELKGTIHQTRRTCLSRSSRQRSSRSSRGQGLPRPPRPAPLHSEQVPSLARRGGKFNCCFGEETVEIRYFLAEWRLETAPLKLPLEMMF
jgi:hypothetical protein